jgi:hypothetical protein
MRRGMVFCISQRLVAGKQTYQAGVTLPMWSFIKVRNIGPVCPSYEAAQAHINSIRPRRAS